ncbi:MAG: hypothetical protein AMXMBFR58_23310 [Phycisphaerae bacterium]
MIVDGSAPHDVPLDAVIRAVPEAMAMVRADGTVEWSNASMAAFLESPARGPLVGRAIQQWFASYDSPRVSRAIQEAAGGESPVALTCTLAARPTDQVVIRLGRVNSDPVRVMALICDAQKPRPVQAELRHAQKLEVVGQLAGGIAHDFNNLITAIFGYLEIASRSIDPAHPAQHALRGVREAAEQAAGVTRTLLTFTRKSAPERARVNLKELVLQSARLLRRAIPTSIQLITPPESDGEAVWIDADANQIQQVILNLALNAKDSLDRGGTIRLGAEYTADPATPGQSRAVLFVSDTGGGIPPDVLPRIFDPFFTTKSDSGHSGLGLAIIQDIIRAHNGFIEVRTGIGEGTTFRVSFPAAQPAPAANPAAEETSSQAHGETLLLVEDDEQVRRIVASQLRQFGYSVIEAGAAHVAALLAEQNRGSVSLVICDLELPDMPGDKLVERLRSAGIEVPVILITGSIHFDPGQLEKSRVILLRKPFGVVRLADTVSKILSAADAVPGSAPGSSS